MSTTFSPHRDAGGIHCQSPSRLHHVDATSALRQLRHSLSRSPSKGPGLRFTNTRPYNSTPTPASPSPLSPPNRSTTNLFGDFSSAQSPSVLAIPYPPSAKVNRPSLRKSNHTITGVTKVRTSPKSPTKRALSDLSDNGNAAQPPKFAQAKTGGENDSTSENTSPVEKPDAGRDGKILFPASSQRTLTPRTNLTRLEKRRSGGLSDFIGTSSPMKRSDGIMNLDQASLESPSAKRRSLHGVSFASDFNIFDHEGPEKSSQQSNSSQDVEMSPAPHTSNAPFNPNHSYFSPIPKRSSSLRKSTLQQRQSDKPLFARPKPSNDYSLDFPTPNVTASKTRNRLSLEGSMDATVRESSLFNNGNLPSASMHPMTRVSGSQQQISAHPLSRAITQSSSSSSLEDSPTHEPVHKPLPPPRRSVNFSRSLPVGAPRPTPSFPSREESKSSSDASSFATPENYKLVKPLPAAFMSTGLISKRRNVDDPQDGQGDSRAAMPDTPCKRPLTIFGDVPRPVVEPMEKPRNVRHSFGTPSTPFNPHGATPVAGTFGKGVSIFGSSFNKTGNRRGSFLSIDGEDRSQSPSFQGESQSSNDCDLPPTPTKQIFSTSTQPGATHPGVQPQSSFYAASASQFLSCKLSPINSAPGSVDGDSDSAMDDSPSACLRLKSSSTSMSSFTKSRLLRNKNSPSPLPKRAFTSSLLSPQHRRVLTRTLSPASPLNDRSERVSPHTPLEGMVPPDPSRLSISAHHDRGSPIPPNFRSSDASGLAPATPTTHRGSFLDASHRSSIGPLKLEQNDVDETLTSRFEKIEMIGTGEFSQVFRVTQRPDASMQSYFSTSGNSRPARTPVSGRVFAVKKSKQPYLGAKDRQRKLQEVDILKTLARADHVVSFEDSWEDKGHLYIQTEFCEEGSLDVFLFQVGANARLDDFRMWKIMLELTLVS